MIKYFLSADLVAIDRFSDYIPFVSTVSNLFDLFQKYIHHFSSTEDSRYRVHLNQKHTLRSIILLIPVLGNIVIFIYDFSKNISDIDIQDELQKPKTPVQGFVYKIVDKGRHCGYLFGSQHVLPNGFKMADQLKLAIEQCQTVYLETKLSSETLANGCGLDYTIARGRKDEDLFGLEEGFQDRSSLYFQFQSAIAFAKFDGITPSLKAWWLGRQEGVQRILEKYYEIAPSEINSLIFERAENWMPRMREALLKKENLAAIVVGTMHLFDCQGNKGCISLLRESGFEVTQV